LQSTTFFGYEIIMWGSDWPVCRLRAEYSEWFNSAQNLTNNLSVKQKENVFGKNAIEFFGLKIDR